MEFEFYAACLARINRSFVVHNIWKNREHEVKFLHRLLIIRMLHDASYNLNSARLTTELVRLLQFVPKLTTAIMADIDVILGNKPVRQTKKEMANSTR